MSILNKIFGNQPAQQAQPAALAVPPNQGNIPAASNTATNPADPSQPAVPPVTSSQNPLDSFKDLWQTAPVKEGESPKPTEPHKLTKEQVHNIVSKANFSQGVTPEMMNKITAGGEGAAEAFTQAMNLVAQQVMTQATMVNNELSNKAIQDAIRAAESKVPALLRDQSSANHLKTTNPLFDNPAVKPVIDATRSQLLSKYPNASDAELTDMTQQYILAMGKAFTPTPVDPAAANETDWEKFLS